VKVGDWVVVGDRQGFVKRIAVRATEVETFDRSSVIIPNSDLISSAVINRTHKDRIGRIDVAIGVAYSVDTRKVSEMLVEIATAHDEVISMPEPFVLFMGFGASSLDFELRCYTDHNIRSLRIATDLRHTIHERFAESGIEIPFP
ncbi:MAG: mechanosensitive ion channel, partial [Alphaproteobacteria bacterium]|nr:mechanosensitive ion channel [Alphaproteobacteria bacterium]